MDSIIARFRCFILLCVIVTLLPACGGTPTATLTPTDSVPAVTLQVSGSGSVTGVLNAIADEFESANPAYVLEVLPGSDTSGGVTGTIEGTLDLAAMSRPVRDSEAAQGLVAVQFGNSSTAIISHPDVGVTALTSEQLMGILSAEITNWSEVGGADLPIAVYVRDPDEGNTVDLRDTYIGETEFSPNAVVMSSQTDMLNVVSRVEGAFGYSTWATTVANGADVVSHTIDGVGVDAPPESLKSYMGVGYLPDRLSDVQPLLDWLLSPEGQSALQAVGVIPIIVE